MTELRTMTFEKVDAENFRLREMELALLEQAVKLHTVAENFDVDELYKIYCEMQAVLVALSDFIDDFCAMPEKEILTND